jgi:ferritin-like metal-binding protein YciE
MGLFTADIKTMDDLFVHQLKDIYYAEKRIVVALPKMIEKTTSPELKEGFETHLAETKVHVRRLEQVFKMHGVEAEAVTCPAIDGIIEEADEVAAEVADKKVLDAALISAAQAVEHYEIARYGTLMRGRSSLVATIAQAFCRRLCLRNGRPTKSFRNLRKAASTELRRSFGCKASTARRHLSS